MGNIERLLEDLRSLTEVEASDLAKLLDTAGRSDLDQALALFRAALATSSVEADDIPASSGASESEPAFASVSSAMIDDDAAGDFAGLTTDDWLTLELLSLAKEAEAVSRSLDETLAYVNQRCAAVRQAA